MLSSFFQTPSWKRFRKNKGAVFGSIIIILSVCIAVFAYFISPDRSPYANRIILETGSKKAGYTQTFLQVKKDTTVTTSFFSQLLYGKEDQYYFIPIEKYKQHNDSFIVEKLIDEGLTEKQVYAINDLAHQPVVTKTFVAGTDKFGRDILSRLLIGTRVSLSVGIITVIISLSIGLILGSLAGFYRGRTDDLIMWFINVIWSIPTILLVFAITLALGKGFWQVFIAIGLTMWVNVARLVRGQVLAVREMEYIEAARALGLSQLRIIVKHIWPNIMGPVAVIAASNFASAIIIEAGLSFLGIGVQAPQPSWGLMVKENYNFIITQNPMPALVPGVAIMLLVLAFNMVGNGLRDALHVRGKL